MRAAIASACLSLLLSPVAIVGQSNAETLDAVNRAFRLGEFSAIDTLFAPGAEILQVHFGPREPSQPNRNRQPSDFFRGRGAERSDPFVVVPVQRLVSARFASEKVRVEYHGEEGQPFVWFYYATYQFDTGKIWRMWVSELEPDDSHVPTLRAEPFFTKSNAPS